MLMRNRFLALAMLTVGSLLGCSKPSDPSKPAAATPSKATDKALAASTDPTNSDTLDRTTLPIPEPNYPHSTVLDAQNATPPPRFKVKAPSEAPNVLVVLIDDMGFGMSSTFGGPIK